MFDGLSTDDRGVIALVLVVLIYLLLRQVLNIARERMHSVKVGPEGLEVTGYRAREAEQILTMMQEHAHDHGDEVRARPPHPADAP